MAKMIKKSIVTFFTVYCEARAAANAQRETEHMW